MRSTQERPCVTTEKSLVALEGSLDTKDCSRGGVEDWFTSVVHACMIYHNPAPTRALQL